MLVWFGFDTFKTDQNQTEPTIYLLVVILFILHMSIYYRSFGYSNHTYIINVNILEVVMTINN